MIKAHFISRLEEFSFLNDEEYFWLMLVLRKMVFVTHKIPMVTLSKYILQWNCGAKKEFLRFTELSCTNYIYTRIDYSTLWYWDYPYLFYQCWYRNLYKWWGQQYKWWSFLRLSIHLWGQRSKQIRINYR